MDYRSILVHRRRQRQASRRWRSRRRSRRVRTRELTGAYLVPTREMTPFTSAMLPDAVVEHRLRDSGEAQARAEARFREAAARHGLVRRDVAARRRARPIEAATLHARYADLGIIGQPRPRTSTRRSRRARARGADGRRAGRVLLVPHFGDFPTIGQNVLIAWKESRESAIARARRAAAARARAQGGRDVDHAARRRRGARRRSSDTGIAAWLARHGIEATVRHEVADGHRRRQPAAVARGGPLVRPRRDGRVQPPADVGARVRAASRASCCRR